MTGLEKFIKNLNFKRATKYYVVISILLLLFCTITVGVLTKDKIKTAIGYEKISKSFRKNGLNEDAKAQLKNIAANSEDIVNAFVLDRDNNVIFKVNNNLIGENSKFILAPDQYNKSYLNDNINKNAVYRVVREDNLILNKDYLKNDTQLRNDIDSEFSYGKNIASKDVYLLNYIGSRNMNNKLFIIRQVTPIPNAEKAIEVTGAIIFLIFIFYWIGLALWVYKDALLKRNNPPLWGMLVLITNIIGLLAYLIYRQSNIVCYKCGVLQNKDSVYCSNCGTAINLRCTTCGNIVKKNENFCTKCGNKL